MLMEQILRGQPCQVLLNTGVTLSLQHNKQLIIDTCKEYGVLRNQCAYVLATADWETNHTFKPVKEAYWVRPNAEAWRKKNLRYWPWYGRGFVQLTWERNYKKASDELGVDFLKDPDAVMEPEHAVKILVIGMIEGWFTGKKLKHYITLKKSNFLGARFIINGTDKRRNIASLAHKYNAELLKQGYGVDIAPRKPSESPTEPLDNPRVPKYQKGLGALLAALIPLYYLYKDDVHAFFSNLLSR